MNAIPKPVETDEELRLACDLLARVYRVHTPSAREWLYHESGRYPNFRREHTRIILLGNEVASALRISTDTILLGEARLKMGGIGWVATSESHRGKGLCRRLMQDAFEYMKANNYHVSMLFGIPNFYERFDYVTTLADYVISVDTVEAMTFQSPLRIRAAKPGDIPVLQRIHSTNNADIPCSLLRTAAHFKNRWERWGRWYVLTDDDGKVEAYFIAHEDGSCLHVDDVGVTEPGLCAAVISAAAKLASDESAGSVRFYVPPPHPLARYLLQFRSTHEMRVERNAGGMMTFVDVLESFENLIPEWESLLAKSTARELRTEFTFCVNGAAYRVRANRGAVDVAAVPGKNKVTVSIGDLMHLVTGYRYVEDILADRRCLVAPEARCLMSVLFPKRTPYVWRFDRF